MEENHNHAPPRDRFTPGRRIGFGIVSGSLLVGYLDMTNQTQLGSLDIHPAYYAPIVLSGITLALSAILGQREQGRAPTSS